MHTYGNHNLLATSVALAGLTALTLELCFALVAWFVGSLFWTGGSERAVHVRLKNPTWEAFTCDDQDVPKEYLNGRAGQLKHMWLHSIPCTVLEFVLVVMS